MALQIKPATKFKQYARVAFWGCPKQGKTHAALAIARAMVGPEGKVGVISSEYASSSLLARKFPHDIIDLTKDEYGNDVKNAFAPARYEEALKLFADNGYQAIIIDSLSHAWEGEGGILERVGEKGGNTFTDGWGKIGTPMYQHLIKAILNTKAHIFITIRAKESYVVEPNEKGKSAPRNVGLKPIIKSSFGYEMHLTVRMDALVGHIEESAFQDEFPLGTQVVRPGEDVASTLIQCLDGEPMPEPTEQQTEMRRLLDTLYATAPATYAKYAQWEEMAIRAALEIKEGVLPQDYTDEHISLMQAFVDSKKQRARKTVEPATQAEEKPVVANAPTPVANEKPAEEHQTNEQKPAAQAEKPKLTVVGCLPTKEPTPATQEPSITAKQIDHIRKLSKYLNKPEPDQITALTDGEARQIIQQLTGEYKATRLGKYSAL
jgi:hypothetical protein